MALTGQQFLELLSNRVRSMRLRYEELDRTWVSMVQAESAYFEQNNMPVKDSTASSLRAWYSFDAHWGPRLAPYYNRIGTANNELLRAMNRVEEISVITEAQIEAGNQLITEGNRWVSRARANLEFFRNSQMGRIARDEVSGVVLRQIVGTGWGNVIAQRAADTAETIEAANQTIIDAARTAAAGPAWLQYAIALSAFTAAGYIWFKVLR